MNSKQSLIALKGNTKNVIRFLVSKILPTKKFSDFILVSNNKHIQRIDCRTKLNIKIHGCVERTNEDSCNSRIVSQADIESRFSRQKSKPWLNRSIFGRIHCTEMSIIIGTTWSIYICTGYSKISATISN